MGDFLTATALVARGATAGAHEFGADLDGQWALADKPNGGYLLAVLGRAAAAVSGAAHPHLTAISGSFIQSPAAGPAVVTAEVLRAGRGSTQVRARLSQDGVPRVEALITQGLLGDAEPWWSGSEPVELPPLADCPRSPVEAPGGAFRIHLLEVVEQYLDPAVLGFMRGKPTGRGVFAGWLRLADGSDWDPLSLLVALDALPPVGYDLGVPGWSPTVQFSAYVRGLCAPGPIRVRATAGEVGGGHVDESVSAWDSKGRLVAQGRQVASVRLPGQG
ncbi:thioesterase family protein [Crossiella sp. CA198]|uniref:thioesterase family protein n=1 Tax=Crossiella sp. CA198 TaxID=3455607 RepID=UPI003F8D25D8